MRGRARSVSAYVAGDSPSITFTRSKPRRDRRFSNVTEKQINRIAEVVRSMSLGGKLRIYVHPWGWTGWRC